MKRILLVCLLLSLNIFATEPPKIGDKVVFKESYTKNGETSNGSWSKEILDINNETNEYFVRWENSLGFPINEAWVVPMGLLYIVNIDHFCSNPNREIEYLETSLGRFKTCKVNSFDLITWYSADVPFGIFKEYIVFNDGGIYQKEVKSFVR